MATESPSSGYRVLPQDMPRKPGSLDLRASPEVFPMNPAETALIVIDMQNGYASKGGYIDIQGFDLSGVGPVIDHIQKVVRACRAMGIQVIFFQNGWDAQKKEAGTPDSPNWWKSNALKLMRQDPKLDGTLITRGTWDYELISDLKPEAEDIVLSKPRYSGFYATQLDQILRARRIRNLLFVGVATNVCVESTLRDAYFLEYFPILIHDAAMQAGPPELQAATIYNVEKFFGWVTSTADFCALTNA